MMEMGFPEDQVRKALDLNGGNLEAATNSLFM